jgi:hypothetical protein
MDWHELHKHKVSDLREMMKTHLPEVVGVVGLKKDELVEQLAAKLGIEKPHKVVVGLDKTAVKGRIRELKTRRDEAASAGEDVRRNRHRREIHRLKRRLRKAANLTH